MSIEIEIFKAGKRKASNGQQYDISIADLEEAVSNYNPITYRAPVIISHNTRGREDESIADSELCYGFPKKIKLVGDTLKAEFEKIAAPVIDWVRGGQLHSVSSSFYLPQSPNNPYPGKLALRHIALLGKTPPAVKGLLPLEMSEFPSFSSTASEGIIEFSYKKMFGYAAIADFFQRLREYLLEKEGIELADRILPLHEISMVREMAKDEITQDRIDEMTSMIRDLQAENARLRFISISEYEDMPTDFSEKEQELLSREQALLKREEQLEFNEVSSFVTNLVNIGKLIPAKSERTIKLLLATNNTEQIDFSEDETMTPRQALMRELSGATSLNLSGDIVSPHDDFINYSSGSPSLALPGASPESVKQDKAIRAWCVSNNKNPDDNADYSEGMFALGVLY